jgi:hypothetical protein
MMSGITNMGRINGKIPDDLEAKIRAKAAEKYRGKRGALGSVLAEAIELYLKQEEKQKPKK